MRGRARLVRVLVVGVAIVIAGVVGIQLTAGAAGGGDPRPPVRLPTFVPPIFPPTSPPPPFEPPVFTRVPDVVGMDINSARAALGDAGLGVGRLSFGAVNKDCNRPEIVVEQSPGGGTPSVQGNKVDIVLDVLTLAVC